MKPDDTELARTLAALDAYSNGADIYCLVSANAARLLRELAADFEKFATDHAPSCVLAYGDLIDQFTPCDCGLTAKLAKWRLLS